MVEMRTTIQDNVTNQFMKFCYTCDDAHQCTTEEACKACWTANGMTHETNDGAQETRELLLNYYE